MGNENRKTILLVEDEIIIAHANAAIITKLGYNVLIANSGEEAIQVALKEENIDLVLMDIDLGSGIDGTKAAEEILNSKDLPIVFLSSRVEPEIVGKTEKITSYGYIVKGSSNTVLDASIKMAFKLFESNQKLKFTKEKLEATLEALPDLLFEVGLDSFCYDYHSPKSELFYSFSSPEIIGRKLSDIIPSNAAKYLLDSIEEANTNEFSIGTQIKLEEPTRTIWFELSISRKGSKYDNRFIILTRNITERKLIENKIDFEQRQKSALINSTDDLIWSVDREFKLIAGNEPFFESVKNNSNVNLKFGDTVLSQELFSPEVIEYWKSLYNQAFLGKTLKEEIFNPATKNTKESWIEINLHPIYFESKITGAACFGKVITDRKKTENSLQKSEQWFRGIFEQAAVGVAQIDSKTGNFTLINKKYAELIGYSIEEMENLNFQSITHPEDLPLDLLNMKKLISKEIDSFSMEKRYFHKNGTIIWVNLNVSPMLEENGNLNFHIAVVEDITKRKQSEEALRASEESLAITLYSIGDAVISTDKNGRIVRMNKMAERLTGWTLSEAVNQPHYNVFQIINDITREIQISPIDLVLESGEVIGLSNHTVLIRNDKTEYHISNTAAPIKDKNGNLQGVILVFSDITEKYRAEEILRESESRFRTIIEASPVPFAVNDDSRNITYLNQAFIKTFGYTREDIPSLDDWWPRAYPDLIYREWVSKEWINRLEKAKQNGNYFEPLEIVIKCKDNTERTVLANAVSLQSSFKGEYLVILYDITDRKVIEEEIKNLLSQKELILKEVHHRIKNNMMTIYSLLSLQRGASKEIIVANALKDAEGRVQSMMVLYDKLYNSADYKDISIQEYLPTLVDQIVETFPNSNKIKIEKDIDNFILDSRKLSSIGIIVNELLTNIMKYAFTEKFEGIIKVSAKLLEKKVSIIIQDNGGGMPKSFSLENPTGFGLILVGMLVKQMRGTMQIETEQGTRILLEFNL